MSHVNVHRPHALGQQVAQQRVQAIEPMLQERFGIALSWNGADAAVTGRGVKGTIEVNDNSISMGLTLGLMLRPLAGKIAASVERTLDKELNRDA